MISSLTTKILDGFKILLPLLLLLLFASWLANYLEQFFRSMVVTVIPEFYYFPGMGLVVGIVSLCAMSLAVQAWIMRTVYEWIVRQLQKIPGVNTVYTWISKLVNAVSSSDPKQSGKPVVVNFAEGQLLGFITDERIDKQLNDSADVNQVAVYFPMSYQIGGYTLLVNKNKVVKLDLKAEELFTVVLSAGLLGKKGTTNESGQ